MQSVYFFRYFKNLIELVINVLLGLCVLSCLNVFTSPFDGAIRVYLLLAFLAVYLIFVYRFKDKIKQIISELLSRIDKISSSRLNVILLALLLILKVVYTIFFYFDPAEGSDIMLYVEIAKQIVATGSIPYQTISHLAGVGLHLAFFDFLHIPYHIGLFVLFAAATIVNFNSFSEIIGKSKAFMVIILYTIMPSSVLLTFCPTHEVFVYFYFSVSLALLNKLIKGENRIKCVVFAAIISLLIALNCLVSPMGYVLCIILLLIVILTNTALVKKSLLLIALVGAISLSSTVTTYIGSDDHTTTMNTYAILIHGSNINSLGEQVDGYPEEIIRAKTEELDLSMKMKNFEKVGLMVVKEQYMYLLTHPTQLIRLLAHKFYIMWSGDYYSIEMAHNYDGVSGIMYYLMLIFGAVIYLFMITLGLCYYRKTEDDISVSNYKLAVLGTLGVSVITVVLNKYTIFITPMLYLVCMYKAELNHE